MTACVIDIRVNSPTKEYSQGVSSNFCYYIVVGADLTSAYHLKQDLISGTVLVKSSSSVQHNGLLLSFDGNVVINTSNRSGVFDVFYSNAKVASCSRLGSLLTIRSKIKTYV